MVILFSDIVLNSNFLKLVSFACIGQPEGGGRISLYADEVSPSDGLKFEQNPQYNCIYWTFSWLAILVYFADGYWMAPVRVFAMQRRQGRSYNMGKGNEKYHACFVFSIRRVGALRTWAFAFATMGSRDCFGHASDALSLMRKRWLKSALSKYSDFRGVQSVIDPATGAVSSDPEPVTPFLALFRLPNLDPRRTTLLSKTADFP